MGVTRVFKISRRVLLVRPTEKRGGDIRFSSSSLKNGKRERIAETEKEGSAVIMVLGRDPHVRGTQPPPRA